MKILIQILFSALPWIQLSAQSNSIQNKDSICKIENTIAKVGGLEILKYKLTEYTETYAVHPAYAGIPYPELLYVKDFFRKPGVFIINKGNAVIDGIHLNFEIFHNGKKVYSIKSQSVVQLSPDSSTFISVDGFDFNSLNFFERIGKFDLKYVVETDPSDSLNLEGQYSTQLQITRDRYSKCRLDQNSHMPVATNFWGGKAYREILVPFCFSEAKGSATIDSLFASIASNKPLGRVLLLGRLYKFNDLNMDGKAASDELRLVAEGGHVFPEEFREKTAVIRIGLENLDSHESVYRIDADNAIYFASIYFEESDQEIYFGFDSAYSQRSHFNIKASNQNLQLCDYPYFLSTTQDLSTGGPDMSKAGLFFIDSNNDGNSQVEEIVFFPPSIALKVNYVFGKTKDLSNHPDIQIELNPIPANDYLNVNMILPEADQVKYQIISNTGAVVFHSNELGFAKEFKTSLDVHNVPTGNYILKIYTSKGFMKKAFIKL